jgi:acetolactate synthase-1/2/3 large subunit
MTGAEIVLQALKDNGVEHIFGYPGGAVLPIYDEIFQQDEVKHILVRHEQGAGHAAEGYARSTGKVGVMLVTSGPGATNAVTPLQDALMDSIPLVCLTGQVPTSLIGSDAFQECDTVGITRPCTKHNWLVKDVNELAASSMKPSASRPVRPSGSGRRRYSEGRAVRHRHLHAARSARDPEELPAEDPGRPQPDRAAIELMAECAPPVIYSGGGVINSGPEASKLLRELVDSPASRSPRR